MRTPGFRNDGKCVRATSPVASLEEGLREVHSHREATALYRAIHRRHVVVLAALAEGAQRDPVRAGAWRALAWLVAEEGK